MDLTPTHRLTLGFVNVRTRCVMDAQKCCLMTARPINLRLPEALYNQIEDLAEATARSKNFLAIDRVSPPSF